LIANRDAFEPAAYCRAEDIVDGFGFGEAMVVFMAGAVFGDDQMGHDAWIHTVIGSPCSL